MGWCVIVLEPRELPELHCCALAASCWCCCLCTVERIYRQNCGGVVVVLMLFPLQMWAGTMNTWQMPVGMVTVMRLCCLATQHLTYTSCWICSMIHRSCRWYFCLSISFSGQIVIVFVFLECLLVLVLLFLIFVVSCVTYTRLTALFPGLPRWADTRNVKPIWIEATDSEWQWHQLGHMQVCTSLQTDNHASTPPLSFLQAGCPSCHPTNSVKALKATCVVCSNSLAMSE